MIPILIPIRSTTFSIAISFLLLTHKIDPGGKFQASSERRPDWAPEEKNVGNVLEKVKKAEEVEKMGSAL